MSTVRRPTQLGASHPLDLILAKAGRARFRFLAAPSAPACTVYGDRLLELSVRLARRLRAAGLDPGDRVALLLPSSPELLVGMLAAWICGAAFSIPASGVALRQPGELVESDLRQKLTALGPKLVLTHPRVASLNLTLPAAKVLQVDLSEAGGCATLAVSATSAGTAVIQFTSGSTGWPRALPIGGAAMALNAVEIVRATGWSSDDVMVTWCPLNHDMGLMAVVTALVAGSGLVLLPTESFMRTPQRWLAALTAESGTLTTAPPFAYKLLAALSRHRGPPKEICLEALRCAFVGGEPIYLDVLERFAAVYADRGFAAESFAPAYGMAECVVLASLAPPGCGLDVAYIENPCATDGANGGGIRQDQSVRLVGNGPALPSVAIAVRDADGRLLSEGGVGRVFLRGPTIAEAYLDGTRLTDCDGWMDTGDLGFLRGGRLFITGRAKDVIKRAGVGLSPGPIEAGIEAALGLRVGRTALVSYVDFRAAAERTILFVEARRAGDASDLARRARAAAMRIADLPLDDVVVLTNTRLPRTSSGKIRRGMLVELYQRGVGSQVRCTNLAGDGARPLATVKPRLEGGLAP